MLVMEQHIGNKKLLRIRQELAVQILQHAGWGMAAFAAMVSLHFSSSRHISPFRPVCFNFMLELLQKKCKLFV